MSTDAAPNLALDHVVIGVSDLEGAARELGLALGRGQSWRGRHPLYGTENVLYRLENAYLELLAPDPEAKVSTAWTTGLVDFLEDNGPGLFALAFATPDVASTAKAVSSRGVAVGEPAEGEGVDLLSGATRRWSNARIANEASRGTPAFFIEHRSPADALPVAPSLEDRGGITAALGASIESAEVEGARRFWRDAVGLQESASADAWRFALDNAALLLFAGGGRGIQSDRWCRLILGVESISRVADRLDGQRIEFEQGDFREGYGLRLDVCGADVLLMESL